jgi:hypothetical protein
MIALKLESGDVIWMDAVLSFSESYSSTVTKHQIESGSSISDHVIQENPKFTLSGVVSAVDFNKTFDFTQIPTTAISDATNYTNLELQPFGVNIGSSLSNPITNLLPDSIRQYIGDDSPPLVSMEFPFSGRGKNVEDILKSIANGFIEVQEGGKQVVRKQLVSIVEFNPDFSVKGSGSFDNCVCTSLSLNQDPESGDAIYPQMSFEQVRFVTLMTTTFPANSVSSSVGNGAMDKEQKGNQPVSDKELTAPLGETDDLHGPSDLQSRAFRLKNPDVPEGQLR